MTKHLYPVYVIACSILCGASLIVLELLLVSLFGIRSLGSGAYQYEKNHDFRLPIVASIISVNRINERYGHYFTVNYMWINSASETCLSSFWSAEKRKLHWNEVKRFKVGSDINIHTTVTGCDSVVQKSDLDYVRQNLIKHRLFLFGVISLAALLLIVFSERPDWFRGEDNSQIKNQEALMEAIRKKSSKYAHRK